MENHTGFEIAVIGMSCRFPGANSTLEFWENIKNGTNSISYFGDDELIKNGVTADEIRNPFYVKANSYVESKEFFDSEFFGYRKEEAMIMDPQIRLFHEVCWEAIEDAGYNISNCTKSFGLFAGGATNLAWENFSIYLNRDDLVDAYTASQVRSVTFMNSIIAYFFNLQGPALHLNTACSTSLVAVQRACLSLLLRECDMALAGGVTINNHIGLGYTYQEGMINSPDGYCRTFDAQANGTVGGEGAGVILLKRLDDAIRDQDNIQAIIKGGAVNNDGNSKQAFSAPSVEGQYKNMLKALKVAGVDPSDVGFIETHGTATQLGDPVEVKALSMAYHTLNLTNFCALGSVKPNIGHLDMAAGVAGLIKAVLVLKNKFLPPIINYTGPNKNIDFENSPFYVNQTLKPWNTVQGSPRRAAVNSLGIGGTNAHVILEEGPVSEPTPDLAEFKLLLFSAKSKQSLYRYIEKLLRFFELNDESKLEDIAYTLQTGRCNFEHKKGIVCKDRNEAKHLLKDLLLEQSLETLETQQPKVVFMFSGQGSQYVNMAKDLYLNDFYFKTLVDKCFDIARKLSNKDFSTVLFSDQLKNFGVSVLDNTEYTQPCLFIIEYALAKTLMNLGVTPDLMIGHSIGEYAAACVSGVISLEDALAIVIKRGELMARTNEGQMLSIRITEDLLVPLLKEQPQIEIAAINSIDLYVVSGTKSDIIHFESLLKERGFDAQFINTSHAFHSELMEDIRCRFENEIRKYRFNSPKIPYASSLTGDLVKFDELVKPAYWFNQLRHTVRFNEGINKILKIAGKSPLFIEVGPGNVLSSFLNSNNEITKATKKINMLRHRKHLINDYKFFLHSIAELWMNGLTLDWEKLYGKKKAKKISLPTYSFEKLKYPVKVDTKRLLSKLIDSEVIDEARTFHDWFYTPTWKKGNNLLPMDRTTNFVLVFADQLGIVESLREHFDKNGTTVITVKVGQAFSEESRTIFTIHPEKDSDYDNLMATLFSRNQLPDKIIHAWSISKKNVTGFEPLDCYFFSLVKLVKSIGNLTSGVISKEIVLLTNDLFKISGFESGIISKALSPGFLKVLSQEYPAVLTSHIDITLKGDDFEKHSKQLFIEIESRSSGKVAALRNGQRWIQAFEQLNESSYSTDFGGIIYGGIYLITGGVGKLGFVISKYLLENFQATVILIGRTDLENVSKNTCEHKASVDEKIERLSVLKQLPGRAFYFQCDISNKSDFYNVNKLIQRSFGKINGVIHAAGITEAVRPNSLRTSVQFTVKDFHEQFKPKVEGLNVLASIFKNQELDFCILMSSISSILGGLGFAGYVPANTYMDFYMNAHKSSKKHKNWVSVNLDGLNFNRSIASNYLSEEDVISVLEKILLLTHLPQIIISKTDLYVKVENWINKNYLPKDKEDTVGLGSENSFNLHAATQLPTEQSLLKLWQTYFSKPSIGLNDNFFAIGGDSLKALTLIGRIQKVFNTNISIKDFFDKPTVLELSKVITSQQSASTQKEDKGDKFLSIPKSNRQEFYRLSSVQNRLYFLHEYDRTSLLYNIPRVIRLKGKVDHKTLELAFNKLICRHEILRTSFVSVAGEPYQRIETEFDFKLSRCHCNAGEEDTLIDAFIRPFDLGKGPLLRAALFNLGLEHHLLMIDMHHIIIDGVSQGILIRDFMALYNGDRLPELRLQYRDYAEWQQDNVQQERLEDQRSFWLGVYQELPETLNLPLDYVRLADSVRESAKVTFEIGVKETQQLKVMAEQHGGTLFIVLLALYNIMLSRLGNQEDIVIGVPTAGRPHTDVEEMLGMFVNTLAMRNYPIGELQFTEFLKDVKDRSLQYFDNQHYQYEDLIDELKVERSSDHNPLFDVMFAYENLDEKVLALPGLELESYSRSELQAKFDLTLTASEVDGNLLLSFEYAKDLFAVDTINRMVGYFQQIAFSITATPNILLRQIEVLSEQERHRLLFDFNGPTVVYPTHKTIIDLFEEQTEKDPYHIAVIGESLSLTYRELDEKSNQVADYLVKYGIIQGDIVGIYMQRSPRMIVYLLGILKSGGTFLAIDPQTVQKRIQELAEQSAMTMLLTDIDFEPSALPVPILDIDHYFHSATEIPSERRIRIDVAPNQPAYVIYTSGSTGDPNGILINHSSLLDYSLTFKNYFKLNEQDRIAQQASLSFDTCIEEIFPILISGGAMVILPNGGLDIDHLLKVIKIHQITVLSSVPLVINEINSRCDELSSLRLILSGGDLLQKEHVTNLLGHFELYNSYGPSESTVCITYHKILNEENVSLLGKPIANRFVYIVDKDMNLCPTSTYGELCVAGAGVARGYLNNPQLTKDKFVDHPFITYGNSKLYKTGDLARWLPDGNIEFLGRKDSQIKIRGFRVELNEIQKKLVEYEHIKDVIVSSGDRFGDKYLVAYYLSTVEIAPVELKNYLLERLPNYMVPTYFLRLDKFPVSKNGKIDKKLLPSVTSNPISLSNDAENETQSKLMILWSEVLQIDQDIIGTESNFFDLGGHSLSLLKLTFKINQTFNLDLSVAKMFKYPTVSSLAKLIDGRDHFSFEKYNSELNDEIDKMQGTFAILANKREENN